MNAVDILIEARDRIVNVGWCQGRGVELDQNQEPVGYCTIAAISAAEDDDRTVLFTAVSLISEEHGSMGGTVAWNDDPNRTRDDVIALYDRTIAKALDSHQEQE